MTKVDTSAEAIRAAWNRGCGSVPGYDLDSSRPEYVTAYALLDIAITLAAERDALTAQLATARQEALEEAASLADDLSEEPSVDPTNPGDIAVHADWCASGSIARSIRSLITPPKGE